MRDQMKSTRICVSELSARGSLEVISPSSDVTKESCFSLAQLGHHSSFGGWISFHFSFFEFVFGIRRASWDFRSQDFLQIFFLLFTIFPPTISNEPDKVDGHATAVTGPSRKEGRNSPHSIAGNSSPTVGLHSSQQRWIPSSKLQRDVNSSHDRTETIFRTVRSILNKLTPENFNKLCLDILNVGITSKVVLKGIVILIFDKSIDEPRYSTLYANLCYRLYHEAPNFDPPPAQPLKQPHGSTLRPNTFRRLLIAKLQDEFENRNRKLEAFDSKVGPLDADEEEQRAISKHHMLGNIKFIGELYRLGILQESIMHKCIKQLINKKKKGTIADMAEDLECLSQIMTTCGKKLDHPKAKSLIDQYFERMEVLRRKHADLPSRIRFMLQDVIDLRNNNWVPRRVNRDTGPKTLSKIRQEVLDIYPTMNINGNNYEGSAPRASSAPGYGGGPRYQMPSYGSPGGGSHFPHSPQYSGTFRGTSPPAPTGTSGGKGGNFADFDFFGAVSSRPTLPIPGDKQQPPSGHTAPPHPTYVNDPMRFVPPAHAPQRYPMYNGYGQQRAPTMAAFPAADPLMPAPATQHLEATTRTSAQHAHKSEQKSGKEIPPRFQRQKQQQKMEMSGYQQNTTNKEPDIAPQNYAAPPGPALRNGGSYVPRKAPVFTPLSTNQNPTPQTLRQPEAVYAKPTGPYSEGASLGAPKSLKPVNTSTRSPRARPANTATVSLRPGAAPRHPSPTIQETNVDAIQPPFQQVIDNAQQQVGFPKKSSPVVQDKPKTKKSPPSKADVDKISGEVLDKFFSKIKNAEQTGRALLDAKVQRKHMSIFIACTLVKSLSKPDEDKDKVCRLLNHLVLTKICTTDDIVEGVHSMFEKMPDLDSEVPMIKSATASLVARLIVSDVISLAEVGEQLVEGYHFPLFLLTLQQMTKVKGREWIVDLFTNSKIDMIKMLPEASQNKTAMVSILEGKQLHFLFPLVHIESKLANQIEMNCSPASIYKWIKENVTSDLYSDCGFTNVLVACCLDHVTKGSSLAAGVNPTEKPSREIKEKERQLLAEIKPVLQKFLHEKPKLQLHALYASQVFCCGKNFPKGLLLRLFNAMYEEDIVDEETYFVWKEDVNDQYTGKGKALFQVNAWLTWLHEAETEDDDAEEN